MPKLSFSKAQKAVLDSGFLDSLGGKEKGVKLSRSAQVLVDLTSDVIKNAEKNLTAAQSVSSGKLVSEMQQDVSVERGSPKVDVLLLPYWKFVNDGVNGTMSQGGSKYSFRNAFVGKSFMESIRKWAIRANLSSTNVKTGFAKSKKERVGQKFTDTSTSTAYAIAKSIKKKGIKPTYFFTDAVAELRKQIESDKMIKALKIDVIESI